jgi:isocitrate dehydrogenase
LGEFFALVPSLEQNAEATGNGKAKVLADTLDRATGTFLDEDRSPGRKLGTIDNRGSHFYLAMYWAQALAAQDEDAELKAHFAPLAKTLTEQEATIVAELNGVQGKAVDIGGYYRSNPELTSQVMRPSATLNAAIDGLLA